MGGENCPQAGDQKKSMAILGFGKFWGRKGSKPGEGGRAGSTQKQKNTEKKKKKPRYSICGAAGDKSLIMI